MDIKLPTKLIYEIFMADKIFLAETMSRPTARKTESKSPQKNLRGLPLGSITVNFVHHGHLPSVRSSTPDGRGTVSLSYVNFTTTPLSWPSTS